MTVTKKAPKYSAAMELAIRNAAAVSILNAESVASLVANDPAFAGTEITVRGVIAKVRTMGLPYAKKEKVSKTGETVATKETLAGEIGKELGLSNVEGLDKAGKVTLRAVLSAIRDLKADAAEIAA